MPELPEVETIARGMDERVRGSKIISVWLGSKPEPLQSTAEEIVAALTGSTLERIYRVGKHIVADLTRRDDTERSRHPSGRSRQPGKKSGGNWRGHGWHGQWLVHLGMTGRLVVTLPDAPVAPHTHAIVQLDDRREIRFVDPRRFGRLAVLDLGHGGAQGAKNRARFTGPGREPLDIAPEAFCALLHGRRTPIKSALLNQSLLHGVGNIYADESLFRAGIRPKRQAARLTRAELRRLLSGLQAVLREAIALGGSSVSDYVGADGEKGFFQLQHRVYLRTGEPCFVCQAPIRRIVLGGRGTHYCPHCQH